MAIDPNQLPAPIPPATSSPIDRARVNAAQASRALTVAIAQTVRPGMEEAFSAFLEEIVVEARAFPGFQSARVTGPVRGDRRFRVVLRFESGAHLKAWMQSDTRKQFEERRRELVEDDPVVSDLTGTAQERNLTQALIPIGDFVKTSVSGIGALLAGTALALIMVNFGFAHQYERLWGTPLTIGTPGFNITISLRHWINDGLMALFFFILGLEIKRELLVGHLRTMKQASFPIAAAIGGALVPAAVFLAFNHGTAGSDGWGIPMATDTAFTIGILTLFGARVQPLLLVFLTAFAIVDDILAVMVIAVFYTASVNWIALGIAAALLVALVGFNRAGIQNWPVYAIMGLGVWIAVFESGVHGTLAGILVAMTVPTVAWISPTEFMSRSRTLLADFVDAHDPEQSTLGNERQQEVTERLEQLVEDVETPLTHMQHNLNPWVIYGILPLFAFANAGIPVIDGFTNAMGSRVAWGVMIGLILAKPVGISLFSWLAVRIGIAALPPNVQWRHLIAVGALGGIGFTMSLFVTELAFSSGDMADDARIGILVASVVSGVAGYVLLRQTLPEDGEADLADV